MINGNRSNSNLKNNKNVLKHVKKNLIVRAGIHFRLLVVGILLQILFMKIVKLSSFGILLLDLVKHLLHLEPVHFSHSLINFTKIMINVFKIHTKIVLRPSRLFLILKMSVLSLLKLVQKKQQNSNKKFLML